MKLPRNLSGEDLAKVLERLGYQVTRQTGSHLRLTTDQNGEHPVTISGHDSLRIGTLSSVLRDIAAHHGLSKDELTDLLFQ